VHRVGPYTDILRCTVHKTLSLQNVPFFVSPCWAALSRRKPASAGISRDCRPALRDDERNPLYIININPCVYEIGERANIPDLLRCAHFVTGLQSFSIRSLILNCNQYLESVNASWIIIMCSTWVVRASFDCLLQSVPREESVICFANQSLDDSINQRSPLYGSMAQLLYALPQQPYVEVRSLRIEWNETLMPP
jgi:hypothetical protein